MSKMIATGIRTPKAVSTVTTQDAVQASPTIAELMAELAKAQAENNRLKGIKVDARFKVSEKGALSVYGCGRFPITLYPSQWTKLISMVPDLEKFMAEHASEFAVKDAK